MKEDNNALTARLIRQDIIGELEAVNQYDAHYYMSDNQAAKAIWASIRDEELAHVGELLTLLVYVSPNDAKYIDMGEKEALDIIKSSE